MSKHGMANETLNIRQSFTRRYILGAQFDFSLLRSLIAVRELYDGLSYIAKGDSLTFLQQKGM